MVDEPTHSLEAASANVVRALEILPRAGIGNPPMNGDELNETDTERRERKTE
jgi:hypothetical protein